MGTEGVVVMDKYQRIQGASLIINMKNIPVFKGVNTVGRNKTAVIDIKHLSVSQNQAVLVIVDDQQHFVTDLGSSNGTFLHDTQLIPFKLYELTHEAILRFGTIVAKYIKRTKNNVTINLDPETMDFTQNMTQTFYAADTQLYTNQTISGSNTTSQNIHSLETQSVDYPLNNKTSRSGENDIHTMETKHADYMFQAPSAPSGKKENIKEKVVTDDEGPVKEDMPNYNQEDHNLANEEGATQVDDYSLKPLKDHDQYLKKLNDREDAVAPTAGSEEIFIGECFEDPFYHNNTNMDFSLPEETSGTNNEEIVDKDRYDKNYHDAPTKVDNWPLAKVVEEASEKNDGDSEATQIVSTVNNKELLSRPSAGDGFEEDSFAIHSKCSSNVIVDDSMAESHPRAENCNESSNESDDLLTMPIVDSIDLVSAPSHDIRSEVKKPEPNLVGKSSNRVKSDSETDVDSTVKIVRRKRRCRKLANESLSNLSNIQAATSPNKIKSVFASKETNTHSDSETDIEDECGKPASESVENKTDNNDSVLSETQKIKPIRKSRKLLFESDSDNEKDILCSNKNEETDSETDIDEESGKAPVAENDNDISLQVKLLPECDVNIPETSLNDTDCIPATQDAFATVFSYKRNDQNHSSEESFKLGLTEFMVEDDCNTDNQIDSLGKVSQPESTVIKKSKNDESVGNKKILHPEEKCMEDKPQEITAVTDYKEDTEQSEQKVANDNIAATVNKDEICEDDYLMPTQKIETQSNINTSENKNSDQTCDVDYYSMPTQELETKSPFRVPTKKYTFKNKKVLLDNTMSTLLNVVKKDDMYIAPTQMNSSESEDVYMQATQTIASQKMAGPKTKSYDDDHLYHQATQEIMLVKSTNNTQTDDMYLMATQPIQLKDQEQAGSLDIHVCEDVYDIPTQVINNEPTSDSQAEMQSYDKNQPSCDETNRPQNPLAQVLQVHCKKDAKRSNTDSAGSPRHKKVRRTDIESLKKRIEEDDSETLSQIQAFVQKPIDKITQQEKEIKKKSLSLRKSKRRVSEDVETLSQIAAFINKPVESKPIIQMNDKTEKLAVPKKRSRRVIKDRSDLDISEDPNGDADISKDVCSDKEETLPNLSKEQEVKSEVDQSFAILASKVNKTRKSVKKTDKLCEIKVAEVKRSSMDIAEASRIKDYETSLPCRKSRRFTTNNNLTTQPIEKAKASSHKKNIPQSHETGALDSEKNSGSENSDTLTSPGRSKDTPKRKQRPKVVFTMLDNPQLESHIRQLGGNVVDSVDMATVLVTNCVKRSQKLLTAVGQGKPICSPEWIISCKRKHTFLEPWDFILIDKEAEKRWSFSLKQSLEKASKKPLLADYTFHIMVTKAADVLRSAIEACGGKCVSRITKKLPGGNFVVIATPDQKSKYTKITKQNPEIKIVEPEAIFDGVLRQELRLSRHAIV